MLRIPERGLAGSAIRAMNAVGETSPDYGQTS
jgi:hypothetical protein